MSQLNFINNKGEYSIKYDFKNRFKFTFNNK